MSSRRRGLGRGLEALLGGASAATAERLPSEALHELALNELHPGQYQPRRDMNPEALESLADSIRAQGVVQPIVARPSPQGYEIIAGERRWRAAQIAGLERIPTIVREVPDQAAMAVALIENIQREDLNPLEEAVALHRLLKEYKLTHQQCAEAVGRSRAAVSNLLRLLDLNEDVQQLLREGKIEMGHARALLGVDSAAQSKLAQRVINLALSVRQTEQLVQRLREDGNHRPRKSAGNPRLQGIEKDLGRKLEVAVRIQPGERGKGRIVIPYNNLEQLDNIVSRIK
jgi:ParB family chromosome partitioning protein